MSIHFAVTAAYAKSQNSVAAAPNDLTIALLTRCIMHSTAQCDFGRCSSALFTLSFSRSESEMPDHQALEPPTDFLSLMLMGIPGYSSVAFFTIFCDKMSIQSSSSSLNHFRNSIHLLSVIVGRLDWNSSPDRPFLRALYGHETLFRFFFSFLKCHDDVLEPYEWSPKAVVPPILMFLFRCTDRVSRAGDKEKEDLFRIYSRADLFGALEVTLDRLGDNIEGVFGKRYSCSLCYVN